VTGIDLSPRAEGCLSDLKLDRLVVGELAAGGEREAALAHLAACPSCQQRRVEIESQPAQVPEEALFRQVARRPPSRRRAPLVAAISLLAGAAAIVLLARPHFREPQPEGDTRIKGAEIGFEILVRPKGAGRVESVLADAPLHPGDVIGFRVRSRSGGHLAIVSVDAAGGVSSYLPGPAGPIPRLPPGEQLIGGAVSLDAVVGRETLVAVLCADEADAARAVAAVKTALAAARTVGELPRLELPCEQAHAALVKEAPP
jgi:hypothetical protein